MKIFTVGVAFHFFVAGNRRHFKFGMPTDHSKSQPRDDKLSLKWAWSRNVIYFKFQGREHTSEITDRQISYTGRLYLMLPKGRHNHALNGRGYGHVTVLKFAVCREAARRAGSSATAELLVEICKRTDSDTNRQTDTVIAILCTLLRAK